MLDAVINSIESGTTELKETDHIKGFCGKVLQHTKLRGDNNDATHLLHRKQIEFTSESEAAVQLLMLQYINAVVNMPSSGIAAGCSSSLRLESPPTS